MIINFIIIICFSDYVFSNFPLNIPPAIERHFNLTQAATNVTNSRVPRQASQHLRIPEDLKHYYKSSMGGQRQGRQIVPGVYSCGHQGKDQFINFINPHYPSHDNVAGTCHFR